MALYNLSAEQSVLGAILIDAKSMLVANQLNLSVYDFFHPQHQIIYNCMQKMYENGEKIDPVTISDELRNHYLLDKAGGVVYFKDLVTAVPSVSNVDYYAKIVKDFSMKRSGHEMLTSTSKNIKSMDKKSLITFSEDFKSMVLDNSNAEDLVVNASKVTTDVQRGGILTGFDGIDALLGGGMNFTTLTVLTGRPGAGKSTFLNQIIANALSQGFNAFLYSGELTYEMSMDWFTKTVANPQHLLRCTSTMGNYTEVSEEGVEMIKKWIDEKLFFFSKEAKADEANISHAIEFLATKKNVKLFILDNLMTLDFSGADKNEKQIHVVKSLKRLAKKYKIVIVLVAHSNKNSLTYKEPHVFEISGASEIANLADYVLKASREGKEPETEIIILKSRITGSIRYKAKLTFDTPRKRFFTKTGNELKKDFGYMPSYEQASFDSE